MGSESSRSPAVRAALVAAALAGCGGAPEPPAVRIEPPDPRVTDALVAVVEGADPSADIELRWFRDGGRAEGFGGDAIPAGTARAGEVWRVEAVAVDGRRESAVAADEVRIGSTPPVLSVAMVPAAPLPGEA